MAEGLNRRELLVATGAALLTLPGCANPESDSVDTSTDRYQMLVDALLGEDIDALVGASTGEIEELGRDPDLEAVVPDCKHILSTAAWWGYFKTQADIGNRPFELPQVVRDNLHWKAPVINDPLAATYGIN